MDGTFNGLPIEQVFGMRISPRRTVLRVLVSPNAELEQDFTLKSQATVKVSIYEFEGKVIRYDPAVPKGVYEVTLTVRNARPGGPLLI